ncbi:MULTISPECIES: hypothetical protein [Arsenicicoccus]|uniref:DUF4244 domain-containing protein n=1 Tax=Arsenicicoccus bolidensis TaxID=229480 RepID=A0ABS9Q4T8_9MICO|nr:MULTISPECIES: hypothetical protein [Arsenicicoccus]MCG7322893.1 hypothetical protein [Arsenicicoccus bolidensis]
MHHLTDAGLALLTRTTATLHVLGARLHDDRDRERGDVPGWVMITLMTAGLVAALALVAKPALTGLFEKAMATIGG